MTKDRMKRNGIIGIGVVVMMTLLLSVSGCATNGDSGQMAVDNAAAQPQQNIGTQGVGNTYVAMDYDFSSEILGHSACVFMVPVLPGDTVEVQATTENPVDFISGDSAFYIGFVTNFGDIDNLQDATVYQEESLSNSRSYQFNGQIDRKNFNLVVRNPSGDYKNIKGHMKIIVHSRFPNSEMDSNDPMDGVLASMDAMKYSYMNEWDFDSTLGANMGLFSVYLMPGDILQFNVTTQNPANFISGSYPLAPEFLTNGGTLKAENSHLYTIYQSESSSNANAYGLVKQIGRKWFVLAVQNPDGTYDNIRGHVRIAIASRYTEQEHNDAFEIDFAKIMGYPPTLNDLPYDPISTADPEGKWKDSWDAWEDQRKKWRIWKYGYD